MSQEILELLDWLKKVEQSKQEELKPYYERVQERDKNRMNIYGLETPNDRVLLMETTRIITLQTMAKDCISINQLTNILKQKLNEASKEDKKSHLYEVQYQLKLIDTYLNERVKTASNNAERK